jgi:DNA gyrase subunit A
MPEAAAGQAQILTVTERGFGKQTPVSAYRLTSRGGLGVINIRTTERNGKVVGIKNVTGDDQLMLITEQGKIIRVVCSTISSIGRSTQGVRLIDVEEADRVVAAVKLAERESAEAGDEDDDGSAPPSPADGDATSEEAPGDGDDHGPPEDPVQ